MPGYQRPSAAFWNVTNFESIRFHARLAGNHSQCTPVIMSNTHAQAPSLAQRLRAETRSEHDAIESSLALPHSIRDAGDYLRLLSGFYGFYLPLEQALLVLDWEHSGIDLTERLKAPLIRADIEACGAEVDSIPHCPTLPPCSKIAEGFGCLYVLEGATLGGAMIHRELRARFGDWLTGKDHYYQCYGQERGAMWRRFNGALDQFGTECDSADQDRVIHSARATFHELQRWLEG